MGKAEEDYLKRGFPRLGFERFRITSPETVEYNCIAWAAEDDERWWWPDPSAYWPEGVPLAVTVDAFVKAYATLGYEPCSDGDVEQGFQKVVLYMKDGAITHAARQLPNGRWTSKLGNGFDIEHTVEGLRGDLYGGPVQFLRRPG